MSQSIVDQLCELMGRDLAENGLHADAVEMNPATYEALKRECETLSPRSHEYHFLAGLFGLTVFVSDEVEDGKIHIGRRADFMRQKKYRDTVAAMREMLG